MAIPTWVPGQVLSASDVNTWLVPLQAFKPSSQGVLNSTTLTNDTDLHVALAANAIYEVDVLMLSVSVAGTDLKWQWTVPAGATLLYQQGQSNSVFSSTDILNVTGTSPNLWATRHAMSVQTGATAGNLQLMFAQNTLNATNTTYIRAGSYINAQRIG